jgi:hypothetical protein
VAGYGVRYTSCGVDEMSACEAPVVLISEGSAKRMFMAAGLDFASLMKLGLPCVYVGRRRKFSLADIARWLDADRTRIAKAPTPPAVQEPIVAALQVERELGVCRRTIRRYVAAGMPHQRTRGRHLRFLMSQVKAWKAREPGSSSAAASGTSSYREIVAAEARGREIARHFLEWEQRQAAKRAKTSRS